MPREGSRFEHKAGRISTLHPPRRRSGLPALSRLAAAVVLFALSPASRAADAAPGRGEGPVSVLSIPASRGVAPFAVSLWPEAQFPEREYDIAPLRLSLVAGHHRSLAGLDIGLFGNELDAGLRGIEIAGLVNIVGYSDGGIQASALLNGSRQDFCGAQLCGVLNRTDGELAGLQIALVNRAANLSGLQIGLFNSAEIGSGVQIGLANYAMSLQGLQIGLVNVNRASSVPFFPIVNFAF